MQILSRIILSLFFICYSIPLESSIEDIVENARPLADTEANDSTIIAGCVNALTGTYVNPHNDCTILSAEPLSLARFYACGKNQGAGLQRAWRHNFYCESQAHTRKDWLLKSNGEYIHTLIWRCIFTSPTGNATKYQTDSPISPSDSKIKIPFGQFEDNFFGLTNTGTGLISGQTNLKNQGMVFDSEKGTSTVTTGANHRYILALNKWDKSVIYKEMLYLFHLVEERKPNGNRVLYKYDKDLHLTEVKSVNAAGNVEFGSLKFPHVSNKELKKNPSLTIQASDGRSVNYQFTLHKLKNAKEHEQFYVSKVERSDAPTEEYKYIENPSKVFKLLSQIIRPKGSLHFDYYTEGDQQNKISAIKSTIGTDEKAPPQTMYHFSYQKHHAHKHQCETIVHDANNHKTIYRYNSEPRLVNVRHFTGKKDHQLHDIEKFFWGESKSADETNLLSHILQDASGRTLCSRSYHYDKNGNKIEEQLWGNLTGKGCPTIEMKGNYPSENGCECYRILRKYSQDGFNLLLEEVEPSGKKTTFKYVPRTNLLESKFTYLESGICLREFYQYDQNAVLVRKIQDNGTSDSQQDLTKVTQRLITQVIPKSSGAGIGLPKVIEERYLDLTTGKEQLLKKTELHYDHRAQVVQKDFYDSQNVLHCSSYTTYDTKGRITKEENTVGQAIFYSYDANGNRTYTKGPDPNVETYDFFDLANRRIRSESYHADGSSFVQCFEYDIMGNVTATIDIFGNKTKCTYNEFNKPVKIEYPSTEDSEGKTYTPVETFTYDNFGNKASHTDPAGYTTHTRYTIFGHPEEIQYPDSTREHFEYTIDGKLAKKIEKNGSYILYTYDLLGRKTKEESHASDRSQLASKSWNYDAFNLLSETDANGNVTTYTYDAAGRKASELRGDAATYYVYDSLGRAHKISQPFGSNPDEILVQVRQYDKLNNVIEERTEDGLGKLLKLKQYKYDLLGNCLEAINYQDLNKPLVTRTTYNSLNKPTIVCDPLGNCTRYLYDYTFKTSSGATVLQKTTIDPKGIKTIETNNVRGKCASIEKVDPYGKPLFRELLKYDRNGNLACWIESAISEGKETNKIVNRKHHGPLNRIEAVIEAEGTSDQKIVRHTYNAFGQQDKVIKPDGNQLCSIYDARGRLAQYASTDGTIAYNYTYDDNNNLLQVDDKIQNAQTVRSYDGHNRIVRETLANGLELSYDYDKLNRHTQIILPDHSSIQYGYTAAYLNEVQRLDQDFKLKYVHKFLERDYSGNITTMQLAGNAGLEKRQYDPLGRRTATITDHWKEIVPADGYDAVGNLLKYTLQRDEEEITYQFAYDGLHQIEQEQGHVDHRYKHDSLNNRLEKDGIICKNNALNQMLSQGNAVFDYDLNGNLIELCSEEECIQYTYDALDRLVKVIKDEQLQVCYRYDHFNRRIEKESFIWQQQRWVKDSSQQYLYIEQNEIGAYESDTLVQLRILGEGLGAEIGSAVAMELAGEILVPVHNLRGDICSVLDLTGEEVYNFCYSAFGEKLGEGLLPWGFASKRYDPETELVYFGRRYYAPTYGRWITADPLGFADGPNLYAYLRNSAITHVDLYGLCTWNNYRNYNNLCYQPSTYRLFGCTERTSYYPGRPEVVFDEKYMHNHLNAQLPSTHSIGERRLKDFGIGFTGGIGSSLNDSFSHARYISNLAGGYCVDLVHNPTNGLKNDVCRCLNSIFHDMASRVVPELHKNWDRFFNESSTGSYLQFAHSEGVANVNNALKSYDEDLRQRILVVAIAPSTYINKDFCGRVWHYASKRDPVPWLDLNARSQNRNTTHRLSPHQDAHFFDHDFESPTYEAPIRERSDKYFQGVY